MNYYMDSEFLEGTQEKRMFGIKYGQTKPTIDLISIAIVAEDNREFYAISKDFNLKEAWNRFQYTNFGKDGKHKVKEYWIRENVLKPIFDELKFNHNGKIVRLGLPIPLNEMKFTYKNFKYFLNINGKTNKQIAFEVVNFIHGYNDMGNWLGTTEEYYNTIIKTEPKDKPQFYGYFADYDWVVFCWLFGKMNNLPKGFPMYCNDLKQLLDETQLKKFGDSKFTDGRLLNDIKELPNYPKLTDEHNALADSRFVRDLHEFLNTL